MDPNLILELTLSPSKWKPFSSGPRHLRKPEDIQKAYESGEAGCVWDPAAAEEFEAMSPYGDAEGVLSEFGDVDVRGELIYPAGYLLDQYPGIWPGPAQQVGDCVSQDDMRAKAIAMMMDYVLGEPDEVTGLLEAPPELTEAQIKQAGFSTEAAYWFRGHGTHGWNCGEAGKVSVTKAGLVIREKLPCGIDLSKYSGRLASKYGRKAPPREVQDDLDNNLIHDAVKVRNDPYQIGAMLAKGAGISSCGGESFSEITPNWPDARGSAAGVSKRTRAGWAHSMCVALADFRKETIAKWREPIFGIAQTWGRWGRGPRRIHNTDLYLPYGFFLARWSDIKNRYFMAKSGINGWKAKSLLDLSPHFV